MGLAIMTDAGALTLALRNLQGKALRDCCSCYVMPDLAHASKSLHGPPMRQRETRCGAAVEPGDLCKHVLVLQSYPICIASLSMTDKGDKVHNVGCLEAGLHQALTGL